MREKLFKKIALLSLSVVMLFAFSLTVCAVSQAPNAIKIKSNQIFQNNNQLTKSNCKKSLPVISMDKKKIVFECELSANDIRLGIVDVQTKVEKNIKINETFTQIMDVQWLNNTKVGIIMHINPNVDLYEIYDITTSKLLEQYYGYEFMFDKTKTNILYMSHRIGEFTVNLNNSVLYTAAENMELDNSLYPSASFNRIAFYEYNAKDDTKSNIIILTLEMKKVKSKVKLAWNKGYGELKWDSENILVIDKTTKYDVVKAKLFMR